MVNGCRDLWLSSSLRKLHDSHAGIRNYNKLNIRTWNIITENTLVPGPSVALRGIRFRSPRGPASLLPNWSSWESPGVGPLRQNRTALSRILLWPTLLRYSVASCLTEVPFLWLKYAFSLTSTLKSSRSNLRPCNLNESLSYHLFTLCYMLTDWLSYGRLHAPRPSFP